MQVLRAVMTVGHLLAFALALSAVLRGDWMILRGPRIDRDALVRISRTVVLSLAALAVTGFAIIALDFGLDAQKIAQSPKLWAKLTVVSVLVINGIVLHHRVFPGLMRASRQGRAAPLFVCALGAVSTTSWLFATFLGIAGPLAAALGYTGFMAIYVVMLLSSIMVAMVFVRPRVESLLCG